MGYVLPMNFVECLLEQVLGRVWEQGYVRELVLLQVRVSRPFFVQQLGKVWELILVLGVV